MKKIFTVFSALLMLVAISANAQKLYLKTSSVPKGADATIDLCIESENAIGTVNATFSMPEGVTINSVTSDGANVTWNPETQHLLLGKGSPYYSTGVVATLNVTVASTIDFGDYDMTIKEGQLVEPDLTTYNFSDVKSTLTVVDYTEGYSLSLPTISIASATSKAQTSEVALALKSIKSISKVSFDMYWTTSAALYKSGGSYKVSYNTDVYEPSDEDENYVHVVDDGYTNGANIWFEDDTDEGFPTGDIVNMTFRATKSTPDGVYNVELKNIKMTDADGNVYFAAPTTTTITVGNQAKELTLSETSSEAIEDGEYTKVTVTRSMVQNVWNTLVLPFDMTADQIAANKIAKVAAFTDATDDGQTYNMTFSEATEIKAGQPYMVQPASDYTGSIVVEDATNKIAVSTTTCSQTKGSVTFKGTFAPISAIDYSVCDPFVISSNQISLVNSPVSLKGFRAYISTPKGSGAKACTWNLGNNPTGINSVKANANADAEGKYIKNGRLVIVKNGKTYNANGAQMK